MKQEVQRQAVRGLHVDSYLFCSIILSTWPFPSCSQNGCCIVRLHICIPGRKKGRRKLTFANWLLFMLRETKFLEVPSNNRLPLTFHWLELGHVATTGCKGAWELSRLLLWTQLGIPKAQEEEERGHGKAADSRCHDLLDSAGNKSFHIKWISLVANLFLWARKYILILLNDSRRHMLFLRSNLMTSFFPPRWLGVSVPLLRCDLTPHIMVPENYTFWILGLLCSFFPTSSAIAITPCGLCVLNL